MHVFEDVKARIQANQVHQFEWTHGMVEAELQGFIDVLRRSNSFLQHVEGFIPNHRVDAAGDEPGDSFDDDDILAHSLAHFGCRHQRVLIGFEAADNFEQLHFVDWVEEMHANTLLGAIADAGNFGDAQ